MIKYWQILLDGDYTWDIYYKYEDAARDYQSIIEKSKKDKNKNTHVSLIENIHNTRIVNTWDGGMI